MELNPNPGSIIRDFSSQDSLRSDRSAGDRARHRQKVRESIRGNIADIISEESIIGKDKNKIIKVPIRGMKEYRFIYGDNAPGVGQGDGNSQPGQVIGQAQGEKGEGKEKAGDQPGVDYYETDVTLDELIEIMFEDLELPFMQRKILREITSERVSKRKGYRKKGILARMDKKRTAIKRIKRRMATVRGKDQVIGQEERFPFHQDDLIYRHMEPDTRPESNAAVICIMDTSGSMDTTKKYLARTFFFLLYQFVQTKYRNVKIVFIAHHTEGREVTEEEFFHKGELGGTFISSGYKKALEIIEERYHPTLWNVYAFHCSDGDNSESDNPETIKMAEKLCEMCNLFGYGEIKPLGSRFYEGSMLNIFRAVKAENFKTVLIEKKEDVWPRFAELLEKDKAKEAA